MIKLPEPLSEVSEELDEKEGFSYKTVQLSWDSAPTGTKLFTEEQMLQFRRDALEEAAKVAQTTICDTHTPTGVKIYGQRAGKAIRALLKETNDKTT
jgi:hypothetical protein